MVWWGADSNASLQCTTTHVMSGSSCAETASAFPSTSSATTMMTVATARTSPQSVVGVCGTGDNSEGRYLLLHWPWQPHWVSWALRQDPGRVFFIQKEGV